jgi:hypothetical protein
MITVSLYYIRSTTLHRQRLYMMIYKLLIIFLMFVYVIAVLAFFILFLRLSLATFGWFCVILVVVVFVVHGSTTGTIHLRFRGQGL